MKIGFVGLGKLGLPVSVAIAMKGHTVYGYEVDEKKRESYRKGVSNLYEPDMDKLLKKFLKLGRLKIVDGYEDAVVGRDLVFIAVPTPTSPPYDYFDTSILTKTVRDIGRVIASAKDRIRKLPVVVVISTILPMTIRKEVAPALEESSGLEVGKEVGLCYSAQFIAMGTTIADYLTPEFCLIGESDPRSGRILEQYYRTIVKPSVPKLHMTWENAELTKMTYNTYIGAKLAIANTIMEFCHKIPHADADIVSHSLSYANVRIVGARYMRGGMGDGGGCHPRDNLALSWLSKQLDLSANPFEFVMNAREKQTNWLGDLAKRYKNGKAMVILGARYKPNTNLIDYSPTLLLADLIKKNDDGNEAPLIYDPIVPAYSKPPDPNKPSVYIIALEDKFVHTFDYPSGSTVIDVWRCFTEKEIQKLSAKHVVYVPVGRGDTGHSTAQSN